LPIGGQFAVVRERGEGAVVGQLGHEGFACWKLEKFAFGRRDDVAAAVGLHPPFGFAEVVERVYSEVGVGAVN
jgi:hypothetical protein